MEKQIQSLNHIHSFKLIGMVDYQHFWLYILTYELEKQLMCLNPKVGICDSNSLLHVSSLDNQL